MKLKNCLLNYFYIYLVNLKSSFILSIIIHLRKFTLDTQFFIQIGGDHGSALNGSTEWSFNLENISKGY